MLPQSPPTTSGIVIISGSNNFDPLTSDFPIVVGVVDFKPPDFFSPPARVNDPNFLIDFGVKGSLFFTEVSTDFVILPGGFVPDLSNDVDIKSPGPTASGIVIIDFFPGAGAPLVPYVPPTLFNERLYPISSTSDFVRVFPEENRRVYPVLPQFSILTPGD